MAEMIGSELHLLDEKPLASRSGLLQPEKDYNTIQSANKTPTIILHLLSIKQRNLATHVL